MFVKQAANVVDLLEYFSRVKQPATLSEISEEFGWPRSSTFNILTTLVELGFLYEPRSRGGFYPTPKWLMLAQEITQAQPLPEAIYRIIDELVQETGETAVIGARAGESAVFLYVKESKEPIRYTAPVGHRLPLHATATGRALLCQYTPAERESILRRIKFERYTEKTLLSVDEVEAELRRANERGWHQNLGGHSPDSFGIAVPLKVPARILSLSVAGPGFRIRDRVPEIAHLMTAAVKRHLNDMT